MKNLENRVAAAVRHFWKTRERQSRKQGTVTGVRDQGARSAVTGGAQMDGFVSLIRALLVEEACCNQVHIFTDSKVQLPGYFRAEKEWDLLVVVEGQLLATIEFKSQVGPSFGNNFNNRTEEALGSATDFRTAYREGAFKPASDPWLGYLMLLEDEPRSRKPVSVSEPHFKVFDEFRGASYAKRYELLLTRLLRERLYDGACFLLSNSADGLEGKYSEPSGELAFRQFATSLLARALAFMKSRA